MEGGQVEAELFVRLLYNGRVVRPSFCQREECPLRTFHGHIMQFLVPEDLEVSNAGALDVPSAFSCMSYWRSRAVFSGCSGAM